VLFFELFPALLMIASAIIGVSLFVVHRQAGEDERH